MKIEPMTPEKLREIQEFPDSMGMDHLVREIERCWAALDTTWEERDAFAERIDARDKEANEIADQLKTAKAVVDAAEAYFIRDRGKSGFRIQEAIKAYRVTQKGAARSEKKSQ